MREKTTDRGAVFSTHDPAPLRCWSLITRAGEQRSGVGALRMHAEQLLIEFSADGPDGPV